MTTCQQTLGSMKVLPFTLPVSPDHSVVVQEDRLPYFYTHFHRHEEIQLTWIQKGEGTLVAGSSMHTFSPQEIYLLGPNMPHVFKSDPSYFEEDSNKSISALTIFFNPEGKMAPLFHLPEMKPVQSFLHKFRSGFKVPDYCFKEISGQILRIKSSGGLDQLMQFFHLLQSLCRIDSPEPLAQHVQKEKVSDFEGMRIGAIFDYVMRHYNKDFTLDEIASVAHMTPQAFCRYFKKHTRHTFISFLNEVRINEACKKLTDGGFNSIGAVAYTCGFNSTTHFNRIFKKVKGINPGRYIETYTRSVGA